MENIQSINNLKIAKSDNDKNQLDTTNLSHLGAAYVLAAQNNKKDTFELSKDNSKNDSKNNNVFKKILPLIGVALGGSAIAAIAKNPQKVAGIFKKFIHRFDHEKLFNEQINPDKYYQNMLDKLKDVKLNLAFNEKTVTDDIIQKNIDELFEKYSWSNKVDAQYMRQNPNHLHFLNVINGLKKEINTKNLTNMKINIDNLDKTITTDEIDTIAKYMKFTLQNDNSIYFFGYELGDLVSNSKEILTLTSILQDVESKLGWNKSYITSLYYNFNPKDKPDSMNELCKLIGVLKKGTIEKRGRYSFEGLLRGEYGDDFRKIRKFYESLNDKIMEKIDLTDIRDLLAIENLNSVEISKILNETPDEILQKLNGYELRSYVKFKDYYGIESINQLNIEQKRKLLRKLVQSNSSTFSSDKSVAPILPSNQEEYCKLMDKLAKSIGVNTKKLTSAQLNGFNKAIADISGSIRKIDINSTTFELDFSRSDFIAQVEQKLSGLSDKEKIQVMDYFGFEIKNGKLRGYPINVNNGEKLSEISSGSAKKVVEDLRNIVDKFSSPKNKVRVRGASEEFNKQVNELFEYLPELKTMIQKQQHETHAYTLDKHVFKVLQGVCTNPKFESLSADDKKILEISSLLHDITKAEGLRDIAHPIESSFDAYYIIQKLNLPESQQLKIYELIKTHNWLQQLNDPKNKDMIENIAQDIAFDTRHTNTFELAKMLCEADIKAVKKDSSFFSHHKKTLDEMSKKVDSYINQLHNSQIVLPQTKIPSASAVKNGVLKSKDGIENVVIYMDKADNDLSKYGFEQGTTKDNWTAIVHALDYPEQMSKCDTFSIIDTEALLSTSYINPSEYRVFRPQGLILDVNYNDIHAGYYRDFGTGDKKILELLKQDYLFNGKRIKTEIDGAWRSDRSNARTYISNKIIDALNLTPEEYYKRVEKIQDCKSITDIEKVDKDFADTLLNVFRNMHAGKRKYGRQYNEMLISRPKIQGVFAYDKEYEKIPEFLRKYAQENNLPIIIFGQKT